MEEKLLKIFQLADSLNQKQDKVYAKIEYYANDRKRLIITINSKENYSYIESCEMELTNNPVLKWENVINLFESYIKGVADE